jgi:hypothetical protein
MISVSAAHATPVAMDRRKHAVVIRVRIRDSDGKNDILFISRDRSEMRKYEEERTDRRFFR